MRSRALTVAAFILLIGAPPALGAFPYARPGADTTDYSDLYAAPGQTPSDLEGKEVWMYAATAADPADAPNPLAAAQTEAVNANPAELNGVRGAHIVDADAAVDTAWRVTTGRPDVVISVLDSGIKWDDNGAMNNVRFKVHLNPGELPAPNDDAATPSLAGVDCSTFDHAGDDINGDGVFNLRDFACDSRVSPSPALNVNPGLFEPQDLLIAFSDGTDADGNGYVDDIAGWDFLDDDNDAYDDVQYGHGTGEIQDSTAEADNTQGGVGTCPNCTSIPLRVGDSFIADVNRFAAAVTYATDNGVSVVQEALGSMNNSGLARQAVDYAYRHGTTVIASAADEAAQHNNWPSSLPHVIMVNSVRNASSFADDGDIPGDLPNPTTEQPASYLKFNGCTNFYAKLTVAIPSTSCSSDATGRGSGIAGLIYSAALDAVDSGKLDPNPDCARVDGTLCPVSPNEVRQLMASGTIGGAGQADDINFSQGPEPSCSPVALPTCTDPFFGRGVENPTLLPVVTLLPESKRYPARAGHDQFYGYGRANVFSAVSALMPGARTDSSAKSKVPPEVEITSPEWYSANDPNQETLDVSAQIWARGAGYTCRVLVAPGHYPNNSSTEDTPPGDFKPVASTQCDGSPHDDPFDGVVASLDVADLKSRFPVGANDFTGREPGLGVQTSSGRPNTAPYGFVVKVVATTSGSPEMTGEDRRAMYLHRDADMLDGFPRALPGHTDGESSPVFADLDGDNRNELILGSSNGVVHAYSYDPVAGDVSELPGWPVRGDVPAFVSSHASAPGYASGQVSDDLGGAMITGVAAADADHDGVPEVYVGDLEGKIYGWDASGKRVFTAEANPAYSGKPRSPFANVRRGARNRTQHGFLGSPVLADLDRDDGGKLEIVAAGMDRHVYAWEDDGDPVGGFPVLAVDYDKVGPGGIDPVTHRVTFDDGGDQWDSGGIVDTPAVGDIDGDERPEIIVGTNEEYRVDNGTEGPFNVSSQSSPALSLLSPLGLLKYGNGRIYAIKPDGDPDAPDEGTTPFVDGWPVPIGIAMGELLPVVGEGINGSPVIAELDCASGEAGSGPTVGTIPAAGMGYLLNPDGSSCLGEDSGLYRTLDDGAGGAGAGQIDRPVLPAVGLPAFGDLGGSQPSFVAPAAGVIRALDLALSEYQGGQDFIAAWDTSSGDMVTGYPTPVNDLSFLTGPVVGDVGGQPGEEILAGTSSMDLVAVGTGGLAASPAWPKLTTDWTIATPLLGSFGTRDTDPEAPKVVVNVTRSGLINAYATDASACSPSSSPRFHHDNANSGDYRRDAVVPGVPSNLNVVDGDLEFAAPGDDLLCGTVAGYEVATSQQEITPANFGQAQLLDDAPVPEAAGSSQVFTLPDTKRYVAIRATDDQGNVGRPAVIDLKPPTGGGPGGAGGADGGSGGGGAGAGNPGGPGDTGAAGTGGGPAGSGSDGDGGNLNGPPPACANEIAGSPAGDKLAGTGGSDHIVGRGGNDKIRGRGGDDCVAGQGGEDRVRGGAGDDELRGGRGRDRLAGGAGDDVIHARRGAADRINCGAGDDIVYLDNRRDRATNCETVNP